MEKASPEVLRTILSYEPETGFLFWKRRPAEMFNGCDFRPASATCAAWNKKYAEKRALTASDKHGYLGGSIFDENYRSHQVIWAMVHGAWPGKAIDHINGNPSDNRLENLRLASLSENQANRGVQANNTSGFKGVSWHSKRKTWQAKISANGRLKFLGYFKTPQAASAAYEEASLNLHGEFRRKAEAGNA